MSPGEPEIPRGGRAVGLALVCVSAGALAASPVLASARPAATFGLALLAVVNATIGLQLALRPKRSARTLRRLGLPATTGAAAGIGVLALGLMAVLGVPVVYAIGAVERLAAGVSTRAYDPVVPGTGELAVRRAVNMLFWTGPVVAYLVWARRRSLSEVASELGLTGGLRELGLGVLFTGPLLYVLTAVPPLLQAAGVPAGSGGGGAAPLTHAILVSVTAGIGEEVLFRGFLQPRIGIVAQAAWFGIEHAAYLSVYSLAVAFVAGLLFGLAYRRTGSLYVPIVAHTLYDLIVIAL